MEEEISLQVTMTQEGMDHSIEHLQHELLKVRTGKASPAMLQGVMVSYYGTPTPLAQVANVGVADARTITIQPWEKSMIGPIERGIMEANLGFNPQNDGELIRIGIPMLTEERRKDLVKMAKALGEDAKVAIRNIRRDGMEAVKKAVKDGYPEDAGKRKETEIQGLTDKHIAKVDELIASKEKDILTV